MSQTIARLEKKLGAKFFDRKIKMVLNENGRLFNQHVESIIHEVNSGVLSDRSYTNDIVKIKIMNAHQFASKCILKFTKLYPQISVSISHIHQDEQDEIYDLCISSLTSYQHMSECVPIIKERVVLAVHENGSLARRNSVSIADLEGEKLISMPPDSALYNLTVEACHSYGFRPQIQFICDTSSLIESYVSEGIGVALVPTTSWAGLFRQNTVLLPVEDPPIYTTSYLLWDNKRYLSPAVQKFKQFIVNEANNIPNNMLE